MGSFREYKQKARTEFRGRKGAHIQSEGVGCSGGGGCALTRLIICTLTGLIILRI